jgi:hypothetical protein
LQSSSVAVSRIVSPAEHIEHIIDERAKRQAEDRANEAKPLSGHGGNRRGVQVDNIKLKGGTSAEYLTRKIARDRPDILKQMQAGKFKGITPPSVRPGRTG